MTTPFRRIAMPVAVCAGLASAAVRAGDLNPPVGPIAPTMKTLTEVEPRTPIKATTTPGDADSLFKITQGGSYYLTGNVQGVAGKMGIEVVASHVTIDLRGFELIGVPGSLAGIDTNNGGTGTIIGTVVRDGTIRGWDSDGIKGDQSEGHFINLVITDIVGRGITINTSSTIDSCLIYACTLEGIATSNNVVIQNTIAAGCGGSGISAGTSSTVVHSAGYINAGGGIVIWGGKGTISYCNATLNNRTGIAGLDGTNISHCHADNNDVGISVGEGGVISQCTADNNRSNGIAALSTSTVVSCSTWSNDGSGINVSASTVTGCTARENVLDGIAASSGSLVDGCTVAFNGDDGVSAGSGCTVTGCTASTNTGDGIQCGGDSRITDNNCDGNGAGLGGDAAGIHAISSDNRIEGNNVTDNDRGIDVDISGNLIIRNSASGNGSNYELVANNKVGPIIVAPDSLAISGDSGGAGVGTANPWSNLSY